MEENKIIDIDFEETIPEGEADTDSPVEKLVTPETETETSLEDKIKEQVDKVGYAYIYDGEILDESKLVFNSKTFCIFNQKTGIPFIYDGVIVRYGGIIEAKAALGTLKMYTGNEELVIVDYEQLKGKSML